MLWSHLQLASRTTEPAFEKHWPPSQFSKLRVRCCSLVLLPICWAEAEAAIAAANSKTHRHEWKRFTRWTINSSKFPLECNPDLTSDRNGLFRDYLRCCENIGKLLKHI